MPSLPTFRRGQPLSDLRAADLNAMVEAIKARTILPSKGVLVRQTTQGVTLSVDKFAAANLPQHQPFELEVINNNGPHIRVYASTLAGGSATDIGFAEGDDPPYLLAAEAGVVQAGLTIDQESNVTSRWIEIVPQLTEDTDTEFYVEIGTVAEQDGKFTVSNSRYGPIDANICRDWFSNPPTYSVTFFAGPQ